MRFPAAALVSLARPCSTCFKLSEDGAPLRRKQTACYNYTVVDSGKCWVTVSRRLTDVCLSVCLFVCLFVRCRLATRGL